MKLLFIEHLPFLMMEYDPKSYEDKSQPGDLIEIILTHGAIETKQIFSVIDYRWNKDLFPFPCD
jgi:hypothetical protein